MKNLKKTLLVITLLLAFVLTACSKETEKKEDKTNVQADDTAKYPITIEDSKGTKIEITKEPERIISMGPSLTELVYKFGLSEKLVARTDYCDYPEEAKEVASIGDFYSMDIEKIIDLDPDVIFASAHFDEDVNERLLELGIKVIVLYEEKDFNGVYDIVNTFGKVFSKDKEASEIVKNMKAVVEEVNNKTKDLEQLSVYYVVDFGEYGEYTATGDTYIADLIKLAGGNNVAKDATGWLYSLEALVEADPDVIIINNLRKEEFLNSANYKDLSAVKNGKVFGIDSNLIDRQTDRSPLGIKAMAEIFYPETFK